MRLMTIALLLLALAAVGGCGKKSSLYLEPGKPKATSAPPAPTPAPRAGDQTGHGANAAAG